MRSRKIVLFDIDGTLLRGAGPHHKDALVAGARQVLNVACSMDGVDTAGRLDRDLLATMLRNAGVRNYKIESNVAELMKASQQHYSANCKIDLTPCICPGVRQTLELLKVSGIPTGLVTGNFSAIAWQKMRLAGIDHYFSFGAFAEQGTTRTRLARLAVWEARRKDLGHKSCQVTLVGDHANDIGAALENGFRAVAVATGVMKCDELQRFQPHLVLNTLEDATLEKLFA